MAWKPAAAHITGRANQIRGLLAEFGLNLPQANIGDVKAFKSGRQAVAWVGIVPRQHSSEGKDTLLGISKRGDRYLRTLLIHGARSVVQANERKRGKRGPKAPLTAATS